MNRFIRILILGWVAGTTGMGLANAENVLKPRIWVFPFTHQENDARFDSFAKVATDVVGMSLKFSNRYQIVPVPDIDPDRDTELLKQEMIKKSVDFCLFGTVSRLGDKIALELSAYNKMLARSTVRVETVEATIDVSDASDRLLSALEHDLDQIHGGVGWITLVSKGDEGDFSVYLNGELVGRNLLKVKDLLNGRYTVEVRQSRLTGEVTIARREVFVREKEETQVEFSIPVILPEEKAKLEDLSQDLETAWNRDVALRAVAALRRFWADTSCAQGLTPLRNQSFHAMAAAVIRANRTWMETSTEHETSMVQELVPVGKDYEDLRPGIQENLELWISLVRLEALADLKAGRWESAVARYRYIPEGAALLDLPVPSSVATEISYVERCFSENRFYRKQAERSDGMGTALTGGVLVGLGTLSYAFNTGHKLSPIANGVTGSMEQIPMLMGLEVVAQTIQFLEPWAMAGGVVLLGNGLDKLSRHGSGAGTEFQARMAARFGTEMTKAAECQEKLRKTPEALLILSSPPGMRVLIDDKPAGRTPLVVADLTAAPHIVSVEDPWFEPQEFTVEKPNRTTVLLTKSQKKEGLETQDSPLDFQGPLVVWDPVDQALDYQLVAIPSGNPTPDSAHKSRIVEGITNPGYALFSGSPPTKDYEVTLGVRPDKETPYRTVAQELWKSPTGSVGWWNRLSASLCAGPVLDFSSRGMQTLTSLDLALAYAPWESDIFLGASARFDLKDQSVPTFHDLVPEITFRDGSRSQVLRIGTWKDKTTYHFTLGYGEGVENLRFTPWFDFEAGSQIRLDRLGLALGAAF